MTLQFDTTIDDLIAFNDHFSFVEMKKSVRRQALIGALLIGFVGLIYVYIKLRSLLIAGVSALLVSALYFALIPAVGRDKVRKYVREIYRNSADDAIGTQTISFEDSGVHSTGRGHSSVTEWSAIRKIVFTPEYCFLYFGANKGHIIPKRCLSEPTLLESKMKNMVPGDKISGTWGAGA